MGLYRDSYSPFYDDEGERLTSAAIAPDSTEKVQEVFGRAFAERSIAGNATYFGRTPNHWFARAGVFLNGLSVTRDLEENRKTREDFLYLVQIAADNGWQEYRTPAFFQTEVMQMTAGFNDHSLMRFYEAIKDAVDPNGIISAGRYGIWPQHLREEMAPWHKQDA